jgi:hypothetical protein
VLHDSQKNSICVSVFIGLLNTAPHVSQVHFLNLMRCMVNPKRMNTIANRKNHVETNAPANAKTTNGIPASVSEAKCCRRHFAATFRVGLGFFIVLPNVEVLSHLPVGEASIVV